MHAQNGRCDQGSDGGKKEQGKRSLARQLTSQTRGVGSGISSNSSSKSLGFIPCRQQWLMQQLAYCSGAGDNRRRQRPTRCPKTSSDSPVALE